MEVDADTYQAKKITSSQITSINWANVVAVENLVFVVGQLYTDGGTSNAKVLQHKHMQLGDLFIRFYVYRL